MNAPVPDREARQEEPLSPARGLAAARALLRPGETEVPPAVQRSVAFLDDLGLWYQLSRNIEAGSCRDAARKRQRLGHEGIPLWDELKSFFGSFMNGDGRTRLVVVHCRGDQRLNLLKLQESLKAQEVPQRLTEDQLRQLHLAFGQVNPFETWRLESSLVKGTMDLHFMKEKVLQVFDEDLLQPIGVPGTVMTNAGDLTWAVEFFPWEMTPKLRPHTWVADVSEPDPDEEPRLWGVKDSQPIGILTGNPPEAGLLLWRRVNAHVRNLLGSICCGDVSMPRVELISVPDLGLSMELDRRCEPVWQAIAGAVQDLCRRHVRLLALPCNTTSFFGPEIARLCHENGVRFLSLAEVTAQWLRAQEVREVALVGINYVADLGGWSAYRKPLEGFTVEVLDEEAKNRIRELAYLVKVEGPNQPGVSRLRDILNKYVRRRHVILALTELSLLMDFQRKAGRGTKVLIDPMELYAEALAKAYLGLPFPAPQSGKEASS